MLVLLILYLFPPFLCLQLHLALYQNPKPFGGALCKAHQNPPDTPLPESGHECCLDVPLLRLPTVQLHPSCTLLRLRGESNLPVFEL